MKNTDNVKIDREILKKNLKKILIDNIPNKSLIDEVKSDMLALGISHGTTQDIFNQRITTEQLSEDVLYYLSRSLFFKLKEGALINPDSYFTINEIEEIKLQKATKLSHEDKKIPYVIRDVVSVARDHKVVFMKARDLVELYNSGLIRYRMETQRQPTIKKSRFDGTLIKVPTLNDRSVVEIKNELVRGTFLLNYITLNSIKQDSFNYDEVTGELQVLDILDIADGHHRSMAMVMALAEGDIDYVTGVNITNWDTNKVLRFIEQEDHKNKMSTRFVKTLDKNKKSNIVVEQINGEIMSDLMGKIVTDMAFIHEHRALTLTDVLQEGIDRYFELDTMSDVGRLKDYLVDGYNYIIDLDKDVFINRLRQNKSATHKAHYNMFLTYMYILKRLENKENYKELLGEILNKIDFSVKNEIWKEMGILNLKVTIKATEKMEDYIDDFIESVI